VAGPNWFQHEIAAFSFHVLDGGGYNNEQILSSTHFRIYQSIGGDSVDLPTKQFAARLTVYLILRAIASLTPATNPGNAAAWATALMSADLGDWVSENITGGAYSKVIRWAFEKQGLYQPAGTPTPNNNQGAPPAVDVYIDDGRAGEYQYQPNFWSCQNIWNRLHNDGGTTHEEPITNQTNYAYVKLKNRGSQNATNVVVKAFHANPAGGLSYPIDWFPMNTAQLAAADVPANNAAEITVGPFEWVPTHVGHECTFMIVSAMGDTSNVDNIAAGDSIPEWRVVPNDNNIGQRNVYPVSGGGASGLTADFNRLSFELKNPIYPSLARRCGQFCLLSWLSEIGGSRLRTAEGRHSHYNLAKVVGCS
jgi:zinc metalloprotease ZmpB